MSLRLMSVAAATILATGLAVIGSDGSAVAHERRAVATNYQFVVGFLNEPSFAYQPNGLSLEVSFFPNGAPQGGGEESEGQGDQGTPVEGADQTLKAEVIVGGNAKKMDLKLEPAFGQKGSYEAHFIPTAPGDYTFHIFGTVNGQNVDEKFDSGPKTFGPMEDPSDVQFPNKVPSNA